MESRILTRQGFLEAVALAAGRGTEEVAPKPGPPQGQLAPPSRAEAVRQGRLVLVAEDNGTNRKVFLQQLGMVGFAAVVARDGVEALELWRSGDFALLLTDAHMPRLDGYALSAAIRLEEQGARRLPIIALTANAQMGEAERCREAGMDDFLTKPVPLASLEALLARWLPATPCPLDPGVLKALVGEDPGTLRDILDAFRLGALGTAAELAEACGRGHADEVGALAHRLKSSALAVGAQALAGLCAELEEAGKTGQGERMTALWPPFQGALATVNEYLLSL